MPSIYHHAPISISIPIPILTPMLGMVYNLDTLGELPTLTVSLFHKAPFSVAEQVCVCVRVYGFGVRVLFMVYGLWVLFIDVYVHVYVHCICTYIFLRSHPSHSYPYTYAAPGSRAYLLGHYRRQGTRERHLVQGGGRGQDEGCERGGAGQVSVFQSPY
ncbi:hypothetical protein EON63_10145 [archaeon]|nr:MAG: hypothetical protein EON63_10145 [archaeon]